MDGIVTLLNRQQDELILAIWRELHEECGLHGIEATPIPHFSWIIAERFDLEAAGKLLQEATAGTPSFGASTSGLGIFARTDPVIYLPVVKDRSLLEFHASLWERLKPLGTKINPHYAPDLWIPHITLAHRDLAPDGVNCAVDRLMRRDLQLEIVVDNLAIICQQDNRVGELRSKYPFGGG
ncbi:MAG TPA: 2'-5' RNA ligase family protein [Anaerolineales bacterium]|nr:2'-5' RNA ligase family protein [Anaerolineales bacterium]